MTKRRFAVLAAFALVTVVYCYPLSLAPSERALDLGPDTRLFLWTLAWDIEALTSHPLSFFDANIFYPEVRTLAYSEHQLGSALVAAPVFLLTRDLLLSMNVVLLLSCLGAGLGAYYLARTVGLSVGASVTAGLIFALAPPRFFRIGQLHLATVYWIPICLALIHRYARDRRRGTLSLAAAAFSLQAWFGAQSGLFLALAASGLVVSLLLRKELTLGPALVKDAAVAALLAAALNLPFALPYLRVQGELGLERSLQEAAAWSPNAASFVASPTHVDRAVLRLAGREREREVLRDAKAFLFPGWVPLGLALLGAARRPRARGLALLDGLILATGAAALALQMSGGVRLELLGVTLSASDGSRAFLVLVAILAYRILRYRRAPFSFVTLDFYVLLGLASLWLALGPDGGLYAWLYHVLPGFDFIRVPSRFTLLTVLAIALLAGTGYEKLRGARSRARYLAPLLTAVVLLELAAFPLDAKPYAFEPSPMDRWLAEEPKPGAVAVLPVPDPSAEVESARRHSAYMLHSVAHFRPIVNGYSGFTPQSHEALFRSLARFPDPSSLDALAAIGVRFVVLHRAGYSEDAWRRLVDRLDASRASSPLALALVLEASFDAGRVYALVGDPAGAGPG